MENIENTEPTQIEPTPSGSNPITALCYSPDGKYIVGVLGNKITMWDATSGKKLRTFLARSTYISIAYNPVKKVIALGDINGRVTLYNEMGKWIKELPI